MTAPVTGQGLEVVVTWGTGTGPTELAAFDAALQQAGVAHLNLIRLSSLIPPGSIVRAPRHWAAIQGRWGDRLYAVYAEHRVSTPGRRACAGLGWVQDEDTGAGVFVEHDGADEAVVRAQLKATLEDLAARRHGHYAARRHGQYAARDQRVVGITCQDHPVAAVVVAAMRVEPW